MRAFSLVRPAGRVHLEVEVLYTLARGSVSAGSCGGSGDGRTRVLACCCNVDCWKRGRGARRATSAARGGTRARATCTLPFRNPGLSLSGWCRYSIPCSASSAFHELPYAEPHVRWEGGGSDPAPYPI